MGLPARQLPRVELSDALYPASVRATGGYTVQQTDPLIPDPEDLLLRFMHRYSGTHPQAANDNYPTGRSPTADPEPGNILFYSRFSGGGNYLLRN